MERLAMIRIRGTPVGPTLSTTIENQALMPSSANSGDHRTDYAGLASRPATAIYQLGLMRWLRWI